MSETPDKEITIRKGSTFLAAIRFRNKSDATSIDLTGSTFRWQGRLKVGEAATQFDLQLGSGLTIRAPQSDPNNMGWLDAEITDVDTEAITDKKGVHALKRVSAGATVTQFAGCITYEEQITEDPT